MTTGNVLSLSVLCCASILAGCVMNEKYEAEKARALNFQRLLAQEEKRTGELDSELKRLKRDTPELEARNRELIAQLEAVRQQMGRLQEEAEALREAAALRAKEELQRSLQPKSPSRPKAPSVAKGGSEKADLSMKDIPFGSDISVMDEMGKGAMGTPLIHEVKPGETLFRLSRQYRVDVKQIKNWNNLRDNMIEVGQKLIVGYQ